MVKLWEKVKKVASGASAELLKAGKDYAKQAPERRAKKISSLKDQLETEKLKTQLASERIKRREMHAAAPQLMMGAGSGMDMGFGSSKQKKKRMPEVKIGL